MKIFTKYLVVSGLALLGSRASAQTLYDDFETTHLVTYPVISGQGTLNQATANPGSSPVNTSATCGTYTRSTTQYDVLVMKPTNAKMADVAAYAAGTKHISIKFRSPMAGMVVQAVLQNKAKSDLNLYPQGKFGGDFNATTTKTNDWETLTFTFTAGAADGFDPTTTSTDVDQMTLLVAPNTLVSTVAYLDDIMGPELIAVPVTTPTTSAPVILDNFESTRLVSYPAVQGTLNETAANPSSSTANNSATCASFARNGEEQYATIGITPKAGKFSDVSDYISGAQKITLKFRSPAASTAVQLVLQNKAKVAATPYNYPQGNFAGTFDATTTVGADTWETLTFTFNPGAKDATVTATDIDQIALLIAPGTASASTYYFDDLTGPAISTATATRTSQNSVAAFATPYPNPASGTVRLPVSLQKAAVVSLAVFDGLGRQVASVLDNQLHAAGTFEAELNSAKLAAGLYTCRLTVDGQPLTRQLSVE